VVRPLFGLPVSLQAVVHRAQELRDLLMADRMVLARSVGSPKALSRRPSLPTLSPSPLPRGRLALPGGQCQRPGWGRDGQRGSQRGTAAENLALGHGSAGHARAGSDGGGQTRADARARDFAEGVTSPGWPRGRPGGAIAEPQALQHLTQPRPAGVDPHDPPPAPAAWTTQHVQGEGTLLILHLLQGCGELTGDVGGRRG
jgi:hypothetical protein